MTECEKFIVDKLIKEKVIMFYTRYVDDTLLIIRKKNINYVLNQFNNFDKKCSTLFLIFIINIPKRVNMYILPRIHYEDGKLPGSVH